MAPVHLTVIAKEPRVGFVKTRLCPPCTPEQAAEIAAAALSDTLDAIGDVARRSRYPVRKVLLFDGDPGEWARRDYDVVTQQGDGLGDRLANGFEQLGPGMIVGMDTPSACAHLPAGLDALRAGHDSVGLARDGGYWVIGLGSVDRRVFDGVVMSRSDTGLAQLRQLHRLGRSVHRLPMTRDLDTFADLIAHAQIRGGGRLGRIASEIMAERQPNAV